MRLMISIDIRRSWSAAGRLKLNPKMVRQISRCCGQTKTAAINERFSCRPVR